MTWRPTDLAIVAVAVACTPSTTVPPPKPVQVAQEESLAVRVPEGPVSLIPIDTLYVVVMKGAPPPEAGSRPPHIEERAEWRAEVVDSVLARTSFAQPDPDERFYVQWHTLGLTRTGLDGVRQRYPHILDGDARTDPLCADLTFRVHEGCWNIKIVFDDTAAAWYGVEADDSTAVVGVVSSAWWVDSLADERYHSYHHAYRVGRRTMEIDGGEVSHGLSIPRRRYVLPARRRHLAIEPWAIAVWVELELGLDGVQPGDLYSARLALHAAMLTGAERRQVDREVNAGRWGSLIEWQIPEEDRPRRCTRCTGIHLDSLDLRYEPQEERFVFRVQRRSSADAEWAATVFEATVTNRGRADTRLTLRVRAGPGAPESGTPDDKPFSINFELQQ